MVRTGATLLVIRRRAASCSRPAPASHGFWELPEALPQAFDSGAIARQLSGTPSLTASTTSKFAKRGPRTRPRRTADGGTRGDLGNIPLSTTRKGFEESTTRRGRLPHKIDMQPRTVAKPFAFANLGDPPRALADASPRSAFRHQDHPAAIGVEFLRHGFDLRQILRRRHHEFQLILVLRISCFSTSG